MGYRIRQATPDDTDWLITQLKKFSAFFGTKRNLFDDEDYARNGVISMMEHHILFIAEHSELGRVGFISGYKLPHPFNPKIRLLSETFWWVDEEHRGSRAGLMLLEAFTNWGKENVDWITFGLEEKSPVNDKCLTKRGFKLRERSYLMEVLN